MDLTIIESIFGVIAKNQLYFGLIITVEPTSLSLPKTERCRVDLLLQDILPSMVESIGNHDIVFSQRIHLSWWISF